MAGGTGGHVFPALAVAQNLRDKGWDVSWLGTKKGLEARVVPEHNIDIDWLSVSGLRGKGFTSKLKSIFLLSKACWQAFKHLRRRKPDVVLGMGGFVAAPGGFMSKVLGIPLVIHEQNRVVGTTNRLLSKIAKQALEAFPNSFPKKNEAICTGNPLRNMFYNFPEKKPWDKNRTLNILVIGGSQGAKILNQRVPEAVAEMDNIAVQHQTGTAMQEEVATHYKELKIDAKTVAFIEDMSTVYQWADCVICRAGAMTVSEVAAVGLPAIFVPLPHAIDDHQSANARYLADADGALIIPQKDLTAASLSAAITQISNNLATMANASKNQARLDATETVANLCIVEAL